MPFVQRNEVGHIVGQFANRQPGFAEEWLDEGSADLLRVEGSVLVERERAWRDSEFFSLKWLRERHRDQLDLDVATTLSEQAFKELLAFMQALRDWPQAPEFPDSQYRPVAPSWIVDHIE